MSSPHGIHLIDTLYQQPRFCAAYLIAERGRAAFVDTGTAHSLPQHLAALEDAGLGVEDVDWVILTHVHLDHAGGAGALMRVLPNARLVVHPRGAPHMVDPARLIAGATAVYGEAEMARSYGEILPVEAGRVVEAPDGHVVELAGRRLECLDTPGHARHHLCVWDAASRSVFSGDTFGLSYREFDLADGTPWVMPTSSPVQFEPEALVASIRRILALDPGSVYVTHYGRVGDVRRLAGELVGQVEAMAALARRIDAETGSVGERHARLKAALAALYLDRLGAHGSTLDADAIDAQIAGDIELNAQGLGVWLDRAKRA
ncbi:MBL fold metallo-hydrolase [Coralloluteibacterium stylophorae]|uniref:MBL fold metallo-hydrolase n=1 Tax=Coralloluteibacterium stylophorae TaxID=1776034 RepID=A0A8J7VVP3_9GAMM|nr:MBL fold metallo-hydrolase [Coralloluteibacterium stylophorae]MBS7458197.1 MBL fold metallo-hydrolase [Coralloluteibacterium stylophorae]